MGRHNYTLRIRRTIVFTDRRVELEAEASVRISCPPWGKITRQLVDGVMDTLHAQASASLDAQEAKWVDERQTVVKGRATGPSTPLMESVAGVAQPDLPPTVLPPKWRGRDPHPTEPVAPPRL